jgi:CheY-like chemotaxis protein
LYAILSNLIKNAIKFTSKGTIEIGYTVVEKIHEFSLHEFSLHEFSLLQFYVKDTGIGIPADRCEAIFERFIQADIADKMAFQGSGLGLAISKAYVEMMGGKIWVESVEGNGTTVFFTLPYNMAEGGRGINHPVSSNEQTTNSDPNDLRLIILIVDDDKTTESLLTIGVQRFAKKILIAGNGAEAIEICRNHPDLDLILMDVRMPVMNGYEATKQIRQFNKDVIIIAQTAFGLAGDRERALEAGCNDHLSKPVSIANLLKLIQGKFVKGK